MADAWDPDRYERFARERSQPFFDLLAMVEPVPGGRVVDLGCGTGELTARLHEATGAAETVGIDSSAAMLERAAGVGGRPGLSFAAGDIDAVDDEAAWDVVFANASLQWVGGHEALLARLSGALRPGGQLAVQVPANHLHPSHRIAAAVAATEPFASAMGGSPPADAVAVNVLAPARYAEVLHELGFADQHVRLQVYPHLLDSTAAVVDWVSGTTLTRFRRVLPPDLYDAYVAAYRDRLLDEVGDRSPYFYAFSRILFHARRP